MSRRSILLGVLLLAALPAVAQQHPNTARGFSTSGSFNPGDVDSINLFNGNLVIRIPIGQAYPVNGALSYGLVLVYNNNVWDYQQDEPGGGGGTLTQAIPNRTSNAGLGWMVSLGRLNPPSSTDVDTTRTVYMSPDGALHTFYPTLHEGETAVNGVQYTRDGTYLRYKEANSEIEMPDGTIHHFQFDGFPDQIRDRFGNQVTVAYTTNLWTISDGHRTQKVWFRTDLPPFAPVVDKVELAAFGGATAIWRFRYSNDDGVAAVRTGCRNTDPGKENQAVPLLTQVTLPDESFYRMPAGDYGAQTATPCDSGMLRGMTLPTLGRIEWDYMEYSFPPPSSTRTFRQKTTGVSRRRLKDAVSELGEWVYTTSLTPDSGQINPQELVNTLVTPLGDKTVSYFSVSNGDGTLPAGWTAFEYGLPLTRYVTDGGSVTRYLSSRVYDCDPGAVNCQLKRTNFVSYARDTNGVATTLEDKTRRNQRMFTGRTNFEDSGLLEAVVHSNFDGLGHYRETNLYGNYGSGDTRTTFVNYNPGQAYPGAFTPPAAGAPWVLNTYTESAAGEPQGSALTWAEHCFDNATGFLLRTRTYASTGKTRSANDVVMRYTPTLDGNGNVGSEESFGGDGASLDTVASLCSLGLPANQYQVNYTYQFGALKTAQSSPGINFKTVDRDIDMSTGMPSKSRDVTALFQTSYEYDTLGRPTYVKPPQDAWTRMIYTPATPPSSLAEVYTARLANGGGTTLAEGKVLYDALGRVREERQRMPDGTLSARTTTYNAQGWRTSVSEMGSGNTTEFLYYDPFGRPGTIRPPDGSGHDVTLSYSGNRSTTRTLKVATSYNPGTGAALETAATTTELYDRQRRLIQVTEPNGVLTKYEYDFGGRLKRVCQGASGATCGQERLFTYDARGFLTSEKHPEKGPSGNGTVTYSNYDSRGHARRMIDGPHDLTYVYDRAERVFQIRETNGAQRLLKEYAYANDNPAGNPRKGKVRDAKRYNYPVVGGSTFTALITETYLYGGREGRVSQRDTQLSVNGATNESFTQSFGWDELGNDQTITYPQCTIAGATGCNPVRTVTANYTNGWLTAVPGYTGTVPGQTVGIGLTYHPNGLVKEVAQGNGVVLTQANDPNGMTRPASITATRSGSTLWTTGTYRYDSAGNIWKAGTAWYEYDALSRVKTGTVFPDPLGTGTQQKQTYTFDNYGNLGSITTQIGANPAVTRNTPASTSTNRLTGTVGYDSAGNLTTWNGALYEYDAFDQMWHMVSGSEDWVYAYTTDDERIWSYNPAQNTSRWTLRDLDGQVLRDFSNANGVWTVAEDYIYRNGQLLAGFLGNGQRRYFALDHLGTPRLVTNSAGNQTGYHVYYPFGEEATAFDPTIDRMQFTGHERDLNSMAGGNPFADDLDYMHARFYNGQVGRFTSVDPIGGSLGAPQSWNRYAYVMGNPMNYIDPQGLWPVPGVRVFAPTGMTVYDFGFSDVITVTGSAVKLSYQPYPGNSFSIRNPSNSLSYTLALATQQEGARTELGLLDKALSSIPIQSNRYGQCVRQHRLDLVGVVLGSAVPKRLVPPFRVPDPSFSSNHSCQCRGSSNTQGLSRVRCSKKPFRWIERCGASSFQGCDTSYAFRRSLELGSTWLLCI